MSRDPNDDPRVLAYLAAVAAVLQRNEDQAATGAIMEHIRCHIREAVAAKLDGSDAVAAALGELDPPESYATEVWKPPDTRLGWWAFIAAIAGPVVGLLAGIAQDQAGWLAFCAIEASAVAAGIATRRQPWGRTAIATAIGLFLAPLLFAALFPAR